MTDQEIYQTIKEYWDELYTGETPSLDRCIWRMQESKKIYNYLIMYNWLAIGAE